MFRKITGAIYRTASRDLEDLVEKGLLTLVGKTGRGAHYVLARKQDKQDIVPLFETGQKQDKGDTTFQGLKNGSKGSREEFCAEDRGDTKGTSNPTERCQNRQNYERGHKRAKGIKTEQAQKQMRHDPKKWNIGYGG
jgi:hypothetical protein